MKSVYDPMQNVAKVKLPEKKVHRGIVAARVQIAYNSKVTNTNQFELGFEVHHHVTVQALIDWSHPLTSLHLVEFEADAIQDVLLVGEFTVVSCLGGYKINDDLQMLANRLNRMINES